MKKLLYILLFIGFIAGSTAAPRAPFHKGVNFSNWFQDNSVNLVGFTKYTKQDFLNVKGMGADAIRLPVNFYAMTSGAPDYTVSPLLFTMLDTVVAWAEEEEMYLILDNHSHDAKFNAHPDLKNILSKMWVQIADHFKDRSGYVLYEIINEPAGFTDAVWADMMQSVVADIRQKDSVHTIVISPLEWSSYSKLNSLPMFTDKNLLYTIHFYGPFLFTHQGADWVGLDLLANLPFPYGASPMPAIPDKYKGTWIETDLNIYNTGGTIKRLKEQIGIAAKFATTRNVPLWCGEFGVYSPKVIPEQRIFWHDTVRKILESQGIAWTMWGYHYGFGIFNTTTWGSFEHDVNIPLVKALGFTAPAQTPYVKRPESKELVIYDDYLAPGLHNVSLTSGPVNMYNEERPAKGRYSISAAKFKLQEALSFQYLKDRDFSQLEAEGYALEFKLRTGYVGKFAVRFIDTKASATDRPWRAQATVSVNVSNPSNDWQLISIPLSSFKDAGSWDGAWYSPEGKFDWKAIQKIEISASFTSFGDSVLYFDQMRIRIPGSPEQEPVTSSPKIPDAGVIEPVVTPPVVVPPVTDPVVTPPTEVVVVPEPVVTPPAEVIPEPDPVVTPPTEVVVVPEPVVTPPVEVIPEPDPVVTPPTEVVIVPEPVVTPPAEVIPEPDPVVTPPTEVVVVPEPVVTPPVEVIPEPDPVVTPPTEVVIVPEPVVTPPAEVIPEPDPVVTPPTEVVVVPEPVVTPPTEVVIVPDPVVTPPAEVIPEPDPVVTPPTEVVIVPEPVVTPPAEVIPEPEPVVTPPTEVVVVPEPVVTPPVEVIPEPDPVVTPPTDVVIVPEPVVTPPAEVIPEPEPVVTPPTEVVIVPEPVVTPPAEVIPEPDPVVTPPTEVVVVPEPVVTPPVEVIPEPEPVVTPPADVVIVPEPVVTPPAEVIPELKPEITLPSDNIIEEPLGVVPPTETTSEIVELDSIVKLPEDQILEVEPVVDWPKEQVTEPEKDTIHSQESVTDVEEPKNEPVPTIVPQEKPIVSDTVSVPDMEDESDSGESGTTELILIPKIIADVPTQVVITLQPAPDVSDEVSDTGYIDDPAPDEIVETITEGTGDFVPIVDTLIPEEEPMDSIRDDVAVVEETDVNLEDSASGDGTGSVKQMVTTSQAEKGSEPYFFRLDKGWLIVESQLEVKVITILDASLRLMRKEEGTNKILLDLPSGNYFVIVKFADGKEIIESAHF